MSQEKLLSNLVLSLSEADLYKVSRTYMKEIEGLPNVFVCNGPWDSGVDLTNSNFDIQIQATVEEKNFEKKLFTDIIKAQSNVIKYHLPNRIYYFYSRTVSNSLKLKYKKRAKDEYGIILTLIDSNFISQSAMEYPEISTLLLELSQLDKFQSESKYFDNVQVRAYYDLMSFGKATDIKFNIIKSFILNYLFNNPNTDKENLLSKTNQHFESKMDQSYFASVIARLSSEQKIKINAGELSLHNNERERINTVLVNYSIEEGLLLKDISNALKKHQIVDSVDEVVIQLTELYESNYALNLTEFTVKETNINDFKTALHKLTTLITRLSGGQLSDQQIDSLVKQLVAIADTSEILPRIASGHVYSRVSDPDRLERYVSQHINNKTIFLDANVILHLLLVHYEPDAAYNNHYYTVAKQFYNFCKSNELDLRTIRSYSAETASIFKDALSIIPFTKLESFSALGGSSNLFYKFYQHLKDYQMLHAEINSFEDFLKEFRFSVNTSAEDNYRSQMEYLLKSLNIEIEELPHYELAKTSDLIRKDLAAHNRAKSNLAIASDAVMFERLADKDSAINPVDPIFCTWDLSLIRVRKKYFEDFPSCTKWYMFTPTRLMDHLSMMNFKLKPGVVSNEVLSILDNDVNFQQMTHTLLDSISTIIQTNNAVGLKYTNMLAGMRETEILEVENKPELFPEQIVETSNIELIFRKLFETYVLSKDGKSDAFKRLFTLEQYFDDITNILNKERHQMSQSGAISEEIFISIDDILNKIRGVNNAKVETGNLMTNEVKITSGKDVTEQEG